MVPSWNLEYFPLNVLWCIIDCMGFQGYPSPFLGVVSPVTRHVTLLRNCDSLGGLWFIGNIIEGSLLTLLGGKRDNFLGISHNLFGECSFEKRSSGFSGRLGTSLFK